MKFYQKFALVFFTLLFSITVSVFPSPAQSAKPNFNRVSDYDVQHYVLRVGFDRANKKVFGDTTVQLKPTANNFRRVELDAAALDFASVRLEPEDKDLRFRADDEKIIVELDKSYAPNDLISLRFKYTATPAKGVYFVAAETENGKTVRHAQIWTQGEPEEARHWFPSFDFPSDKATTEQFITAEKGETVIGNGAFLGKTDNADGTATFHYRMSAPHSTYLTSFVVGKYVKSVDSYKNIPLGFYVYPEREKIIQPAFGKTKQMMRAMEELTGVDYPFNKYDQTIVANFNFGGMENITATTLADTEIFASAFSFAKDGVEDLVAHEIAHSWFGNLVTCRNWAELWLNEGLATFMEAAYREKAYGRADYLRKIRSDARQFLADDAVNRNRHGLFNVLARPDGSLFDATTYQKGGAVVHTLRETVGDQAFWRALNVYLDRHKFGSVETADLRRAMEEASGTNLEWFFRQWVYGAGSPKLEIKQTYSPKNKTLVLSIAQTQEIDGITPEVFLLPLEAEIKTASGTKIEKLDVKNRAENFSIKTDGKPSGIVFDKNEKIPLKTLKIQPLVTTE